MPDEKELARLAKIRERQGLTKTAKHRLRELLGHSEFWIGGTSPSVTLYIKGEKQPGSFKYASDAYNHYADKLEAERA
jgi:hypothetical protein